MMADIMIGRKGKPFCGDCCCAYPKGSGKRNKRILKRKNKAQEKRAVRALFMRYV